MKRTPYSIDAASAANHMLAAAIGGAVLLGSAAAAAAGLTLAPWPFVWRDVAVVCFLSALPLAASLAAIARRPAMLRASTGLLAVEVVVLVAMPAFYKEARWRNDSVRLAGFIEQSRWGDARGLADRMLMIRLRGYMHQTELSRVAGEIRRVASELDSRVAAPLPSDLDASQRIDRARDLAMLGHTAEALSVLDARPELLHSPLVCNLRGTIYETRSQWRQALQWYSIAKFTSQQMGDLPPQQLAAFQAATVQAATGIAYCQRKLGNLPAAEKAYHELLELAPTADTHFLLAQFYEDNQQASQAEFHARQAMAGAPQRYLDSGQRLLDRLATSQFGCWAVFRSQPSSNSRP